MDKDKKVEGEEACCSGGSCGSGCGCGIRVIAAVVLLLLGGIIGYLMGAHCGYHKYAGCPFTMANPAPAK